MNTQTPFFILSAETDIHSTNENAYRSGMLSRQLRRAGFAVATCYGAFEGVKEKSVLVIDETPHNDDCFNAVMRLAKTYAQKYVLGVDANRTAILIRVSDGLTHKYMGNFRSVTEEVAKASKSWNERAGRYYVCS